MNQLKVSLNRIPDQCITRFAPSPTGYLHLGHVLSAIFVFGIAAAKQARCLLRIEDHDQGRSRDIYTAAIIKDLQWLGFIDSHTEISSQSQHSDRYEQAMLSLERKGLLYGCDCTRKQIEATMGLRQTPRELKYTGRCRQRHLAINQHGLGTRAILGSTTVSFTDLILGEQSQTPQSQCGDLLIKDRDGNWTYQFAVAVDDLMDQVNLVIRGADLLQSTGRQILLQSALNPAPHQASYLHHPLIQDPSGKKLSKRFFSKSISDMRAAGAKPEDVIGAACYQAGMIPQNHAVHVTEIKEFFVHV